MRCRMAAPCPTRPTAWAASTFGDGKTGAGAQSRTGARRTMRAAPAGALESGFGTRSDGKIVPGGTTTLVLDADTLAVEQQYRSLAGTIRNCSGGVTPWGSWLTCEEAPTGPGQRYGEGLAVNHGWVFEVPAAAGRPGGRCSAEGDGPLQPRGRLRRSAHRHRLSDRRPRRQRALPFPADRAGQSGRGRHACKSWSRSTGRATAATGRRDCRRCRSAHR